MNYMSSLKLALYCIHKMKDSAVLVEYRGQMSNNDIEFISIHTAATLN